MPSPRGLQRPLKRAGRFEAQAAAPSFRSAECAARAITNGIEPHAGHGQPCDTGVPVAASPQLAALNSGQFLSGAAIYTGLEASVARMRALMDEAR